jgi:hypothetical protein
MAIIFIHIIIMNHTLFTNNSKCIICTNSYVLQV